MSLSRPALYMLVTCLCMACQPAAHPMLNPDEKSRIEDTVGELFAQIPEATKALDFDRLLGFYREGDDLTYVAQGRVTQSYPAFENVMHTQFRGIAEADLQWKDTYICALTQRVATATATFEFKVVLESGAEAQSAGTYMAIYVIRDGSWQIEYSSHTFPASNG